jgi:hypothetical protein
MDHDGFDHPLVAVFDARKTDVLARMIKIQMVCCLQYDLALSNQLMDVMARKLFPQSFLYPFPQMAGEVETNRVKDDSPFAPSP